MRLIKNEPGLDVNDLASVHVEQSIDIVVTDSTTAALIKDDFGRSGLQFARMLLIVPQTGENAVRSALNQGISGIVLTSSPVHELLAAVRMLATGKKYLCPTVAQQLAQVAERDLLTSREDEVLRLLAKGQCNKSIARSLDIAVGTVKVHVKSIMSKLDASSRTEAASIATERGLVDICASSVHQSKHCSNITAWLGSSVHQASYA